MLRLCQDAGFTLAEIQDLVTKQQTDHFRWRGLVDAKMVTITESLRKLNKARDLLAHALECEYEDITRCPKFRQAVDLRSGPGRYSDRPDLIRLVTCRSATNDRNGMVPEISTSSVPPTDQRAFSARSIPSAR